MLHRKYELTSDAMDYQSQKLVNKQLVRSPKFSVVKDLSLQVKVFLLADMFFLLQGVSFYNSKYEITFFNL